FGRPQTSSAFVNPSAANRGELFAPQLTPERKTTMSKTKLKLVPAGIFAVCAFSAITMGIAWAPPPQGLTTTPPVGPTVMEEIHSVHETPDHGVMIKTRGLSDVYVTHLRIVPGGHGGWHSHPGPSIISVRAGTATFYDECDEFEPQRYPAGTGFVEDAEC